MINLSTLTPDKKNPRKMTQEALGKLKESIKRDSKFMSLRPIIVDENNVIIGGNQRYRALRELGYKEIPNNWLKKATDLTQEEKRRFSIIDNSPKGMTGDWDKEILKQEYEEIELEELGLEIDNGEIELAEPEFEKGEKETIKLTCFAKDKEAVCAEIRKALKIYQGVVLYD